MSLSFDGVAAHRQYAKLMTLLGLQPPFTLNELKQAIEGLRGKDIEIAALPLPPDVYGSAKLADDGNFYLLSYNQALDERLCTRTILHELAHVARGDVEKSQDKACYISRADFTQPAEFEVEFTCSLWLEQLVNEGTERASRLWLEED